MSKPTLEQTAAGIGVLLRHMRPAFTVVRGQAFERGFLAGQAGADLASSLAAFKAEAQATLARDFGLEEDSTMPQPAPARRGGEL